MDAFLNAVSYVFFFVVLIAVLVFVHELGHFLFAKLFKVKVHTFALGMGPRIVGFRKGETDYRLAAFPIGGYVKMLGEDPAEELLPTDKGRAFGDKPVWQRLIIVAGGPAFSLVFPIFLYLAIHLGKTQVTPVELGVVIPEGPAATAGLVPGDVIEAIDGQPVRSFDEFKWMVEESAGKALALSVRRDQKRIDVQATPETVTVHDLLGQPHILGKLGVLDRYELPLVGVRAASPADTAGMRSFDFVTAVNDRPVPRMVDLETALVAAAGQQVTLTVRRLKTDIAEPPTSPASLEKAFEATPHRIGLAVPASAKQLLDLGLEGSSNYVFKADPDGAAAAIGIAAGDRLVSLDGRPSHFGQIFGWIQTDPKKEHTVAWLHGEQLRQAKYKPRFIPAGTKGDLGLDRDAYDTGIRAVTWTMPVAPVPSPALIGLAIQGASRDMASNLSMMVAGISALVTGQVNLQSLGGVIMIGQLAGDAAKEGASYFLWIMALISLNLGLINLFPIPVLDGGQIVLISIEGAMRRPISLKIKERIMLVGVVLLVALMVFATRNDIMRLILS